MNRLVSGLSLLVLFITVGCGAQRPAAATRPGEARTLSSFDAPTPGEKPTPAGMIHFAQAELAQVLNMYAEVSGRSIIRAGNLPDIKVTFSNQSPMTRVEVLQALDTVLAAQDIAMVILGTQYVKAVPAKEASLEPGPVIELPAHQLPDSSSFLIYIVRLKNVTRNQALPALQPFAKLPNSIIGLGAGGPPPAKGSLPKLPPGLFGAKDELLILRDYSANVRRMLQVLETLEQR